MSGGGRGQNHNPNPNGNERMSNEDMAQVVDALVGEMSELFHGYVGGEVPFEELSFEMYDTLQTLFAIANGNVTIEYDDNNLSDDDVEELFGRGPGSDGNGGPRGRQRRN